MKRADYIYSLEKYRNRIDCIVIEDLNLGSVSVTNEIENIINDISSIEKVKAQQFLVVYKDSTGQWDGYNTISNEFIGLAEDTWHDAIALWISRKTEL